MKVRSPIQINLVMGGTKLNSRIKPFQNTVFPLMWAEISVDRLTDELILLLQMLFIIVPPIQTGMYDIITATNFKTLYMKTFYTQQGSHTCLA